MEELVGPLSLTAGQDMEEGSIGKLEYMLRCKEVITMVSDGRKRPFFPPVCSDEGGGEVPTVRGACTRGGAGGQGALHCTALHCTVYPTYNFLF
jgi:hypothetical protein